MFEEDTMLTLDKLFQKTEKVRALPILLCEVEVILTPKPNKNAWQRKLQANFPPEQE